MTCDPAEGLALLEPEGNSKKDDRRHDHAAQPGVSLEHCHMHTESAHTVIFPTPQRQPHRPIDGIPCNEDTQRQHREETDANDLDPVAP